MGFKECRIFLSSPNCTFYVGQVLHGRMEFDLDKMETFRGVYAKIKGFCYVHWTTRHTRRVDFRSHEYTVNHDAYEEYIKKKTYLVGGESGEHHLEPGHHVLPFECLIPATCPSSFEGAHGHVRYEIKVVVDRAFKFDHQKKVTFKVISPVDLNLHPLYKDPVQFEILNTFCCWCFSAGSCQTLVKLKAGSYCPGQTMPIEVSCKNNSTVNIGAIKFFLEKKIVYHATDVLGDNEDTKVMAVIKKGPIPANTTRNWTVEMEVPALNVYNLDSCRFIDIYHLFKVVVGTSACHTNEDQCCGILIGSVPIFGSQDILPKPAQCEFNQAVNRQNTQGVTSFYLPPNQGAPYITTTPYPVTAGFPGSNPPDPIANQSFPGANSVAIAPYPTNQGPYPPTGCSYPTTPPPPYTDPGLNQNVSGTTTPFLKTGTLGFGVQPPSNNLTVTGSKAPYIANLMNPYIDASAPELSTPGDENKSLIGGNKNSAS